MNHLKTLKRLVFIGEYFYPANNAPGARFKPLVDELQAFFKVHIYTSSISKDVKDYNITTNFIEFPSNHKGNFHRLFVEVIYSIETFLRLLFSKGDVYYITSPSFINCIAAACYCILFRRKYIVDIRDDYPQVYFDTNLIKKEGLIGRFFKWIEITIYDKAYIIIAATDGLKKNIERHTKNEIYLLRNGYSENMFNWSNQKYDIFTLVFHGNLSKFQDIDLIIDLAQKIDEQNLDVKIIVIGFGFHAKRLESKLPNSLTYLGSQPYEEIAAIIQRAHVGLSFRIAGKISEDSFPVRTYEYMGVGIPILITPISEAGDFIQANKLGYQFNPGESDEILKKILELKDNPSVYHQLVSNVLEKKSMFSRERLSKEFSDYLNSKIQ